MSDNTKHNSFVSPKEIAELKRLAEAATPGPWSPIWDTDFYNAGMPERFADKIQIGGVDRDAFAELEPGDAEFIAAARTAIPRLIAHVEELQARIDRALSILSWMPDHDGDDLARVEQDYMHRAQLADDALAVLSAPIKGDSNE